MIYFIGIGSNIDPAQNIPRALARLRKEFRILKTASVYETPPQGPAGDLVFWNTCVRIESDQPPKAVKESLRTIESELGRQRVPGKKFAPRTIDLDLVPDREDEDRPHVMIPLAEISPRELSPFSGKTFSAIAGGMRQEAARFRKIR